MRSLHVVKLRCFRELKHHALRSVARRVGKVQGMLSVLNLLKTRLRRLLKQYRFKTLKRLTAPKPSQLTRTLISLVNRRFELTWNSILLHASSKSHLEAKIRRVCTAVEKPLKIRICKVLADLSNQTSLESNCANRCFLTLLQRIDSRLATKSLRYSINLMRIQDKKFNPVQVLEPRTGMVSHILSAVVQNQGIMLGVLSSKSQLLLQNSQTKKRVLLKLVHFYESTILSQSKRGFRVWAGAKGLYGRLAIKQKVEELDAAVANLKDQVELKCTSAYQSGPGRGGAADFMGSGEESRELVESNRNLKDELALSYLHFVEAQNNQLLQQREQLRQEIAILEDQIRNNKLAN